MNIIFQRNNSQSLQCKSAIKVISILIKIQKLFIVSTCRLETHMSMEYL